MKNSREFTKALLEVRFDAVSKSKPGTKRAISIAGLGIVQLKKEKDREGRTSIVLSVDGRKIAREEVIRAIEQSARQRKRPFGFRKYK